MYIRGLIPRNFPIGSKAVVRLLLIHCQFIIAPIMCGSFDSGHCFVMQSGKIRTNPLFKKVQTFCEEKDLRSLCGIFGQW